MIKKLIFLLIILSSLFTSCTQAPDDKGTLVIESSTDHYTIQEVYARRVGDPYYSVVWSSSNSGIEWTHANIYLEPGQYHIYVKMCYYDTIYTYPSTGISTVCINEGQTKFLYVRNLSLYQ